MTDTQVLTRNKAAVVLYLKQILADADQTKQNVWDIAMQLGPDIFAAVAGADPDLSGLLDGEPGHRAASDALARLGVALPDDGPPEILDFKPRGRKPPHNPSTQGD